MSKKASEIFNESNYVFSSKVSFAEVFPEVEQVNLEITEIECLIWMKEKQKRFLTSENTLAEYMDCSNPLCDRGGVSVGDVIRDAISNKAEKITDVRKMCVGSEKNRSCMHAFIVTGTVKYK